MKLIDLLKLSSAKYPDRLAVKDDFYEITYSELMVSVKRLSDYLWSAGYGPGVKIAIILSNSALYFTCFFAVSLTGATIVPMSSKMTAYEAAGFVKRANVSLVLTGRKFSTKLKALLGDKEQIAIIIIEQNSDSTLKTETCAYGKIRHDATNSDVALMVYTSGTTGMSKIVMLTDDQLISNMFVYRSVVDLTGHNIVYCSLRLRHIYCICAQVLTHISLGDTFIVTDKPFFIKDFFRAVQHYKVTVTAFVPYMATLMAEYPYPNQFDLSSLKCITLSGAKTPKLVYQKLTKVFRHIKFINTYGMSEAGSRVSISAPDPNDFPIESVGKPIPGVKIRITDENRKELPAGCIGEVEVRGSGVFKGYFNQPELTKEIIAGGWLRTGDMGKLDGKGNLYLIGRKKEIILCGGENIFPAEIEEILLEDNSIREAAVIAWADKRFEEVPFAFVVSKNSKHNEMDVINICRRKLSSFKVPRRVFFIDEIPKLGTVKADKGKLKEIGLAKLRINT